MSLNVVPHAARTEGQNVTAAVASGRTGKCSRLYVLSAVRKPKCLSNLVKVDRYIVTIATVRPERTNNLSFNLRQHSG